jgi:hypothetical protein
MAEARITKGSKQYLPVTVIDYLNNITTLDSLDLRFDVYKADDAETAIEVNMSADNEGMTALPLIDATLSEYVEGYYNLYITFVKSPQAPRLGPFRFRVDD